MNLPDAVAEAARLMRSAVPDNETVELLTALGVTRAAAQEIIVFLPLVYGRELLRRSGCNDFPATYTRRHASGATSAPVPLARKPVWRECERYLQTDLKAGSHGEELLAIANASAELQTAHRLLDQGADLHDITFPAIILASADEGPLDAHG